MPYYLQGDAKTVFSNLGLAWMVEKRQDAHAHIIEADLTNGLFLGNDAQAQAFYQGWKNANSLDSYWPEAMSGGDLYLLLGTEHPFALARESNNNWDRAYHYFHFAFVNDNNALCALSVFVKRDTPGQWFMGLVTNAQCNPEQRQLSLLSSSSLAGAVEDAQTAHVQFAQATHSNLVQQLIAQAIDPTTGAMNIGTARIAQLLRPLQIQNDTCTVKDVFPLHNLNTQALFAENRALDLIAKYNLKLSTTLLEECLDAKGELCNLINSIPLAEGDFDSYKVYLHVLLATYEAGANANDAPLFEDPVLLKTVSTLLANPQEKNTIITLLKQDYNQDLFRLILSEEAYRAAIPMLVDYNLDEMAVRDLFRQPKKLQELQFIHTISDADTKKLCMIFWIKDEIVETAELAIAEYQAIMTAVQNNPKLAEALINRDGPQTIAIEDLKKIALDKVESQVLTIKYLYKDELIKNRIRKDSLKKLKNFSAVELSALSSSLAVLFPASLDNKPRAYQAVLDHGDEGQVTRMFLPQFATIEDKEPRETLIKIFLIGIITGDMLQGSVLKGLKDRPALHELAKSMHERFLCVTRIQALKFPDKAEAMMRFAADKGTKAEQFRRIILRVEKECKDVFQHVGKDYMEGWQTVHEPYKKRIYELVYDFLITHPQPDVAALKAALAAEEAKVLEVIDPKITNRVEYALIIIANFVLACITGGASVYYKYKQTGNYLFFAHTNAGEQISLLDKALVEELTAKV